MTTTLFLRCEAPLQAWGERSRWDQRDTSHEPTKSGIVGLLACTMGRNDDDTLRNLALALVMGVRCDQPGSILTDYHTVSGGVMSAQGKVKATKGDPETVVSSRRYLAGASYLVALQGESALIDQLAQAVQAPTWVPYLGRKACVPSQPIFAGVGDYPSLKAALLSQPLPESLLARKTSFSRVTDTTITFRLRIVLESLDKTDSLRRDVPLSNRWRTFGNRYTKEDHIDLTIPTGAALLAERGV